MFSWSTPRYRAIAIRKPSLCVGGDVLINQGKCSRMVSSTLGEGGNHASRTSALTIEFLRSRESKLVPMASKNAPPWKQQAGLKKGKSRSQVTLLRSLS